MRCRACDKNLDDAESINKDLTTGEYLDMCRYCLSCAGIISEIEEGLHEDTEGWKRVRYDDTRHPNERLEEED